MQVQRNVAGLSARQIASIPMEISARGNRMGSIEGEELGWIKDIHACSCACAGCCA